MKVTDKFLARKENVITASTQGLRSHGKCAKIDKPSFQGALSLQALVKLGDLKKKLGSELCIF